jgi:hypothetical protein
VAKTRRSPGNKRQSHRPTRFSSLLKKGSEYIISVPSHKGVQPHLDQKKSATAVYANTHLSGPVSSAPKNKNGKKKSQKPKEIHAPRRSLLPENKNKKTNKSLPLPFRRVCCPLSPNLPAKLSILYNTCSRELRPRNYIRLSLFGAFAQIK